MNPMQDLQDLAEAIRRRNEADAAIARIIGRPAEKGHIGEFIAAGVFGIDLEASAAHKGSDGRFVDGPLRGRSVNIKFYGKQEGMLDIRLDALQAPWRRSIGYGRGSWCSGQVACLPTPSQRSIGFRTGYTDQRASKLLEPAVHHVPEVIRCARVEVVGSRHHSV